MSIVTPTLNAERFLEEYVASVLTQNYPHLEIVFVDGGSTDTTVSRLRGYQQQDPQRVRILIEPNTGPGQAWNRGLKAARGQILGCLGADDICEAGALDAVVTFFDENPRASVLHGGCDFIDENGAVIFHHRVPPVFDFDDFLNSARYIATPSAYYRRPVMERIGWLDSSGDDFDVMIRIAKWFDICSTDRVLSRLRIREDSAFNRVDLAQRLPRARETFLISRRHGGRRLSRLGLRYYVYLVLATLRLNLVYRLLRKQRSAALRRQML